MESLNSGSPIKRYSSRRGKLDASFLRERLKGAASYDRIAGFFRSSLLDIAGEELEAVSGKIRMVCNSDLRMEDIQTARAAAMAVRKSWSSSEPEKLLDAVGGEKLQVRFRQLYQLLVSEKLVVRVLPDQALGLVHGKAGVIRLGTHSVLHAEDCLHFSKTHHVANVPTAAGAYRPEAFTESGEGKMIRWGVHIGNQKGSLPFIQRFDVKELKTSSKPSETKPNIVFIMADDLGYSDIGCYGARKVKTPHIDRLAAEGVRFTDFHTAASICSPSRAAFLTGAYPQRAGLYMGIHPNRTAHWLLGLHSDEVTIAEQFKQQGYATHMVGKWHLGTEPEFLPRTQGFDHYYGMPCNYAHSPKFFDNDKEVFAKTPLDRLTQLYTHRVTSIIRHQARSGEPFFLYFAHNYPHTPYQAGKDFRGTSQDGVRGDVMQELDWSVGQMMTALKEAGIAENTIVIFTSDNGPTANQYAQPYRGTKYVTFEGGHRVPFIARWPGKIDPGTQSNQLICNVDMLATFAAVTNQQLDKTQRADSVNVLPTLLGDPEASIRDHLILAPHKGSHLSVRKGKWMYIPARGSGGFTGSKPSQHAWGGPPAAEFVGSINSDIEHGRFKKNAPPAQLYDLEADVNQTRNVHDEHPEVVKELSSLLARYSPSKRNPGPRKVPGNPAKKTAATQSTRSASFDFESGKLEPWRVVEGKFGHVIGSRSEFFHNRREYNKQGQCYLTTLEPSADAEKGMDSQTGVIVSPLFVPESGKMTFRIGGGRGQSTYAALCTADGEEVAFARGINDQVMQQAAWDLTPYVGQKMFIKIVDESTTGWGHVTVDDFQFDAKVLPEYPELLKTK